MLDYALLDALASVVRHGSFDHVIEIRCEENSCE